MQRIKAVTKSFFSTSLIVFFFFGLSFLPSGLSSAQQSINTSASVAPVPAWVKTEALTLATNEQTGEAREGVIRLLSDQQVRVTVNSTERYFHNAEQIISQPGIEHASQLQLVFDPTYQRLVLHRIQIIRGNQTINALKPREIKFVQQESELEERLFNGTLAALVILNDVRVGDVIEYDYSLNGENPILGGKFADVSYLVESEPVSKLRYRLLWPTARPLKHAVRGLELKPTITAQGNLTEYVWVRMNTAAPEASSETNDYPILHLSEFQSWQDVVAWALPLYRQTALSPQLRAQIETWRKVSPEPEKQMLAALRFVQDEIRYLGIEMGRHSHLPHAPSLVLSRRYGDCKDKALLLCVALNALGIAAQPALVNTELYEQVAELPPSPYAFDHVIVRAQLNERDYWFDATASLQRGDLKAHVNPNFGSGLPIQNPIHNNDTELAEIAVAASNAPLKTIHQVFKLGENNTAALEITTTYRGPEADDMRSYLASSSPKDLAQEHLRAYTDSDRSLTADGKPQINDDAAKNELTIIEHFNVGRFWKDNKRLLVADRITQELPWVNLTAANLTANDATTNNKAKDKRIRLSFPLDVEHIIEVQGAALPERQDKIEHEALTLQFRHEQVGDAMRLSYRLRSLRPFVSARDARGLNEAIERMEDVTKVSLSSTGRFTNSLNQQMRVFGLFGLLLMPLVAWFAVKWMQHRQRSAAIAQAAATEAYVPPGATPATALPASEMQSTLQYMLCVCGANYPRMNWPQVTMLYDGQKICAMQLHCATCEQPRDLHFVLPSSTVPADSLAPREEGA